MDAKEFHLGDVLSVTASRLVSLDGMQKVHELLDFMTGDKLFTHQLPRAAEECRPALLTQFPQLAEVDTSDLTKENWKQWLDEKVSKYGENFSVKPLSANAYQSKDPLSELHEMIDAKPPIMFVID